MPAPEGNQYGLGNEGGRPTKYRDEYAKQAYKLCLLGYIDEELATFFEVHEDTINEWKTVHEEFSVSIKKGKDVADAQVAQRLYKRAVGYSYDEIHYEKINIDVDKVEETDNDEMKMEAYKKKLIIKEVVPDTTAQIFWLKNRQPKKWRDKTESVNTNLNQNVTVTTEEAKEIIAAIKDEI